MSEIIFPTGTSAGTPASDDVVMFADISDSNSLKDCTFAELPVSTATVAYISSAISGKADNTAVVHNTLDETVAGIKTFSSSPIVPTPSSSTQVATKGYVDSVAFASGSGDVTGPASSTDNALARFDSTTGKVIKNSGATLDNSGNVTFAGAIQQNEASARSWGVSTRTGVTTFPVPSIRPSSSNSVIALDLMPNGSPTESPSNGFAWIDVCNADILTGSPPTEFGRFGIRSTELEIGTKQINGGVVLPISFTVNSTKAMRITSGLDVIIGNTTTANSKFDIFINASAVSDTTYSSFTDTTWSVGDRKRAMASYAGTTPINSIDNFYVTGSGVDFRFSIFNGSRVDDVFVMNYQGRFGIGTTTPSYDISFTGQAAKTIGLERHITSNTAGSALTISAGSASSGATNKNGGGLVLSSGVSTGSGRSDIGLKVYPGLAASTTDNIAAWGMYMFGSADGRVIFGDSSTIGDTQLGINLTGNVAKYLYHMRHTTSNTAGNNFVVQAGGATSGATDKNGGDLALLSGIATGSGSSKIQFYTATAGGAGTTDRTPSIKMTILGSGNVGIGETSPDYLLDVNGTFGITPGTSVTPVDNGDIVFEFTNNTTLTFKGKGSDGTVRSGTVTLA